MKTATYSFEGTFTAISSISHGGGQNYGINQKLRREKFVSSNGDIVDVPVISGNSMRGILRDLGMAAMVKAIDAKLSLQAFHLLFSGGSLTTASSGKVVDLESIRAMRRAVPLLSVFGGAIGNAILPGKLKVNKGIPLCAETAHLLPERFRKESLPSCWDIVQEEMYTRRDDSKRMHGMHSGPSGEEDDASQQMMYYVETFIPGTTFYWRLFLEDPTDIELRALIVCLEELKRSPFIGGKSAIGMGEIRIDLECERIHSGGTERIEIDSPTSYLQYIMENNQQIKGILNVI